MLAAIAASIITHISAHAETNPKDLAASRIYLHGADTITLREITLREITLREITQSATTPDQSPPPAWLAYLSACHTDPATTSNDERATLATGLQLAGYTHTIATLSSIPDNTSGSTATPVHQALTTGQNPAHALHQATTQQRRTHPNEPIHWAPYTHNGP